MSTYSVTTITNHLIEHLPEQERLLLLSHCHKDNLEFGDVLCEQHEQYNYLYFPMSGFISLVTEIPPHKPLEMGIIGNEGMLGATMVLGIPTVPMQAIVQGKGTAWRITVGEFQQVLQQCPQLRAKLMLYLFILVEQLSLSAACAHFHEIEQRLARWLLMSQDRAHSNEFHLTHQFLADMLGVRRSGVTLAAGILQQNQIIRYSRGKITIINRRALEKVSCGCYQNGMNEYLRLLGQPNRDSEHRLQSEQGTP